MTAKVPFFNKSVLKMTFHTRGILRVLRLTGRQPTADLVPTALVRLAEAGYVKVGIYTTLTFSGKVVADHLLANSK